MLAHNLNIYEQSCPTPKFNPLMYVCVCASALVDAMCVCAWFLYVYLARGVYVYVRMCMFVCVCASALVDAMCVFVCEFSVRCVCMCASALVDSMCMWVCVSLCACFCVCIWRGVCMYVCLFMYVCVRAG